MSNTLTVHGSTWIAADIHLGPHGPNTAACFYRFLDNARIHCDQLLLCGDIFNAWIGDDAIHAPDTWLANAIRALQCFSQEKKLYLMRGNRDFLLGPQFAAHVGAELLPDTIRLNTGIHTLVLTHGDELCTDDHSYQRFRRIVRSPLTQQLFAWCPYSWRLGIANYFRKRSKQAGQYKNHIITDVNLYSCQQLLAEENLQVLVHGHTHRPATHHLSAPTEGYRIVLPDWECDQGAERYGWLAITDQSLSLHQATTHENLMWPSKRS